MIRPIEEFLRKEGVVFKENCTVEDIDFAEGDDITVTRLHLNHNGETETVELGAEDLCFMIKRLVYS